MTTVSQTTINKKSLLFWLKELDQEKPRPSTKLPKPRPTHRVRIDCQHIVPGAYLTSQEASCLRILLMDRTVKQAAQSLKLSHRTVEFYVNNIKKKFKVKDKNALLDLIKN